jgi:hypothetical protein
VEGEKKEKHKKGGTHERMEEGKENSQMNTRPRRLQAAVDLELIPGIYT